LQAGANGMTLGNPAGAEEASMERDLILGYMAIKLASFLAMYLHRREEAVQGWWIALCVAGFAGGAVLLARSWRKARALAAAPATQTEAGATVPEPSPSVAPPAEPLRERQTELA
jgi:hypothetical protein